MDNILRGSKYRKYMPKVFGDVIAMSFTLIVMHFIALFELFVILPSIDGNMSSTFWLHTAAGLFLYGSIISCFILTIMTDATSGSTVLPSILKPGWRYCAACEANSPPRSYHCWACKICILRRDHHCMFTGNCIGHTNQRYFMTMIFYYWLAASYCTFLNMDYTWEILGGYNWKSIFTMIMPLMSWILGLSETYNFSISFVSSTCLIAFFLLATLFAYHMLNIMSGQTIHESAVKCKDFDRGWQGMYIEVLTL